MPFFRCLTEGGSQNGPGNRVAAVPLAPQGRPKTFQKRIGDTTSIFHRFGIDSGTHFGDMLKSLAHVQAPFHRQCGQFLPAPCFKIFGFHGQHLKVSAVALPLQSADTGWCQAFQIKEANISEAPPSEACPRYLPASTRGIETDQFEIHFRHQILASFLARFFYDSFAILVPLWLPFGSFGAFWIM